MNCTDAPNDKRFLAGLALVVLVVGLLIRFVFAPTLTYPFDIEHWAVIAQNIDSGNGLYGLTGYFYTPVWGYIMGFETLLMNIIGGLGTMAERFTDLIGIECLDFRFYTATTTTPLFNVMMKVPLIIVDVITGYLLWDLVMEKTSSKKKADLAFALWFLCPIVVYMSSIQAQFDCISAMFALLTILLLRKDHCFLAGAMFTIASLIKFFPAFLIFVLVAYLWKKHKDDGTAIKCIAVSALGAIAALAVLYAPQILDGTFVDSLYFVINRASESKATDMIYAGTMVLITVLAMYYTARHVLKSKGDLDDEFLLMSTLLLSIATMISTGPQYCIAYLPLLAYFAAISENKLYMRCLIAIGILSMLVGFLNNSLSLLTSAAEYWGWFSPESIIDAMRNMQGAREVIANMIQAVQMIVLFMTFIFLFTDSTTSEHPVVEKINRLKNYIGGVKTESKSEAS